VSVEKAEEVSSDEAASGRGIVGRKERER
jgi:hypothetical protein